MTDIAKPPRPASTILLLRDSATSVDGKSRDEIEVFMMVRHYEIDFNSGALVFPGGSVDRAIGRSSPIPRFIRAARGSMPPI
jgi:8-oxo-dGTP pyrophosphatase MutT (NUDIX family)